MRRLLLSATLIAAAACSPNGPAARAVESSSAATTTDASEPPAPERLVLTVFVRVMAESAEITDVVRSPDRRNRPRGEVPPEPYRLDLLDAQGAVLASVPFDAPLERRGTFEEPDGSTIHVRVPAESADAVVRIDDLAAGATLRVVRCGGQPEPVLATAAIPAP